MTEPPAETEGAEPEGVHEGAFRADLLHQRAVRLNRLQRIVIAAGVALLLIMLAGMAHAWRWYLGDLPQLPANERLASLNRAPGMTFLDRNGRLIATRGPKYGLKVALSDLPPYVPRAFLAAEDRRFYSHDAVDWRAVGRAAVANLRAGRTVEGASTLTQQLARDLFLGPERTFKRKLQEVVLARRLYKRLGRDGVLQLYLNRVYLGENAYGVDAAARTYFGKPARSLSLAEAAVLAGLPKAPSSLDPTENADAALRRGRLVLDRMAAEGWITPAQAADAARQPVVLTPPRAEGDFGWVIDMAAAEARRLGGGEADLVVRLSVDPALQSAAAGALRSAIDTDGRRLGASQGAVVVLAPDGAIRALVGGRDRSLGPFNRAIQARRQPGSAFKPFVWAAALEAGVDANGRVSTRPVALGPYQPGDAARSGELGLEEALAVSSNSAAVRLAREAGPQKVADLAGRFGVPLRSDRPGLSIALGAYETTLLDLTSGYQAFQQGGRRTPPWLVEEVLRSDGRSLWRRAPPSFSTVYDSARAGAMVRMMAAVVERGTGKRGAFGRPAAGKTGTSQDHRDAWFVGFTPDWLAGVWIGNDDNSPMRGVEGGGLPADVWRRVMIAAHADLPSRDFDARTAAASAADEPTAGTREARAGSVDAEDRETFYRTLAREFEDAGKG